jgi:protease-4
VKLAVLFEGSSPMLSIVQSFFRGTWKTIRFIVFFMGIISFLIFLAVVGWGVHSAHSIPTVSPQTTLLVNPSGNLSESGSSSLALGRLLHGAWPMEQAPSFYDLRRSLAAAAGDKDITQVLIDFDQMSGLGWAQAEELGSALDNLKRHGKTVVAYGHDYNQTAYLVAAHASKVVMDPDGSVQLAGLARYQPYLKTLFDRLGVTVHLFRVGVYKSAAEPYVRSDESPDARAADTSWMNSVWSQVLTNVSQARGIDLATLTHWTAHPEQVAEKAGGDLASAALQAHLIDSVMTPEAVESSLSSTGRYDSRHHRLGAISWDDYLRVVDGRSYSEGRSVIAVVPVDGEIVDSGSSGGQVSGATVADYLRKARFAANVKAVVLRVDSPGGAVTASEEIRRQVEMLRRAGKVVVVSMGNTAASGGYWLSSGADSIWAQPTTVTGSIGIFGLSTDVTKAMANLGVQSDGVATSAGATAWQQDPTRPVDDISASLMQSVIDRGYQSFLSHVASGRGLTVVQVGAIAQGRVWSGAQAQQIGLVNHLGGLAEALDDARTLAHLTSSNSRVRLVSSGSSGLSLPSFLGLSTEASLSLSWAGEYAPLVSLWPRSLRAQVETLIQASRPGTPLNKRILADCMCTLEP